MKTLSERIEIAANIAIICVSLLIAGYLGRRLFWSPRPAQVQMPAPARGGQIRLPILAAENSERTFLLVLKKGCSYCAESAPFYRRVVKAAEAARGTQIVVAMDEPGPLIEEYLRLNSIPIAHVVQTPLRDLNVHVTPTVILVNRHGIVQNAWPGKLDERSESEVLQGIR
jgi:hypothetical protein